MTAPAVQRRENQRERRSYGRETGLAVRRYPPVVHMMWTSGKFSAWREGPRLFGDCGVIDFAGSGTVHMTGGVAALCAVFFMGVRKGFPDELPEGQPVYQALGVLILWMGWSARPRGDAGRGDAAPPRPRTDPRGGAATPRNIIRAAAAAAPRFIKGPSARQRRRTETRTSASRPATLTSASRDARRGAYVRDRRATHSGTASIAAPPSTSSASRSPPRTSP